MDHRRFARELRRNMTDAEKRLWYHLRGYRMQGRKFRRQQPVGHYIVDFVHFGSGVIVEADGGQHNDSVRDKDRDAWLQTQGFRILRFWNHDILRNTETVLEQIRMAVEANSPSSEHEGEKNGD